VGIRLIAAMGLLVWLGPRMAAQTIAPKTLSREMLTAHNRARARMGVPPLNWSPKLADVAQEWADYLLASGRFTHRPKSGYGENLFAIQGGRAKSSEVVADWAAEARDYDAARNTCRARAMCGHYTQVVWRNTRQVGCGVAQRRGRQVWVCNYDPPGNWVGERPF
jgi:pathogenesis-related protein 1